MTNITCHTIHLHFLHWMPHIPLIDTPSLFNTMPMHNPTINEKLQPPINRTDTPLTAVHTRNTHSITMANTDMLQPDPTHISTDEIQQEADTSGILRTEFNNFPRIPNNPTQRTSRIKPIRTHRHSARSRQ